ncbi:caspase family protein [Bradyrhizobium cenepequi]
MICRLKWLVFIYTIALALALGAEQSVCATSGSFDDDECTNGESGLKAIANCTAAIKKNPKDVSNYYTRAEEFEKLRMLDKAIKDYSRIIELQPKVAMAFMLRGKAFQELRKHALAIRDFSVAISRQSPASREVAATLINRAYCHQELGDSNAADADYQRALTDYNGIEYRFNILNNRGLILEKLGNIEAARANYEAADRLPKEARTNRSLPYPVATDFSPGFAQERLAALLAKPSPRPIEPASVPAASGSPSTVVQPGRAVVKQPEPVPGVNATDAARPLSIPNPGRRVAIVLGNSSYKFMPILTNPKNDALDVADALKNLSFETIVATDLDRAGMNAAVDQFSRILPGSEIAVVYYAGHGMQFAGKNYLLPVDANLESADDVNRFRLMPVDDIIDVLGSTDGMQLLVLDACRNNPVERAFKNKVASAAGGDRDAAQTRGFSRIEQRGGLVVTYATTANNVASDGEGRNSPFTKAFLKYIATPDLEIRQMLNRVQSDVFASSHRRQLPEVSSLYAGPDICLKPAAGSR